MNQALLTPEQVAERAGITLKRLTQWRNRGEGPKFLRMPAGVIRYSIADVERWEQSIREGGSTIGHQTTQRNVALPVSVQRKNIQRNHRFGGYRTKPAGRIESRKAETARG